MSILRAIIAFIITLCIASIFDLAVNYLVANTTEWKVFEECVWKFSINIGRLGVGYFYGIEVYKYIYKKLGE